MTSDIVERLRGWKHATMRRDGSTLGVMQEAADEIESLRSRLEADFEIYHQVYMVLLNAGTDKYLGALEQAQALVARAENAERALGEADERHGRYVKAVGELAGMAARLAEAERDAARYRFIKQWARRLDITGYSLTNNEHFEPRIDEAMAIASQPSSADEVQK